MQKYKQYLDTSLSARERAKALCDELTLYEKISLISTHQLPIPRLGIGEWFVGHEVARGYVNREQDRPTTVFPQPIGLAATFDSDLMLEIGKTCAREGRAYYNENPLKNGGLMVWGPTVDLVHDPRWGRTEECYGEDPFLAGEMTIAYTLGMRGEDPEHPMLVPTLKHFCANSHEQNRLADNANLNARLKHEYYYAAFREPIVRGGASSVMTAYNSICHAPAAMNHDLQHLLKDEWGLDFIVTDGGDFSQNVTEHAVCDSHAKALQACLIAGMDCFTDVNENVHPAVRKALAEGLICESDLDKAITNMLCSRIKLGLFPQDRLYTEYTVKEHVNTPEDRALNLQAAREGIVLLENHGLLPYEKQKLKTVALFGANADCNLPDWYTGTSSYHVSIRQALVQRGIQVTHDCGYDIVKLKAPNGCYVRAEGDSLLADCDEDTATAFYYCVHDDQETWVNLRAVETGQYLTMSGTKAVLGKTNVYGWYTYESLSVKRHPRYEGMAIASYLHGELLSLDDKGHLVFVDSQRLQGAHFFTLEMVSRGTDRMLTLAKGADAVVYCGGNDPQQVARECWDRKTIMLPSVQKRALDLLCKQREDVLFLLVSSYPYAFHFTGHQPQAILWTSHAGPELGNAVADTLLGNNNPSGHLPMTWYAYDEDLPDIKNYDIMETQSTYLYFDGEPLYPFGHGLSYSKFKQKLMHLHEPLTPWGVKLSLTVTNESEYDGVYVAQIYLAKRDSRYVRPLRKLCAFQRIPLKAWETKTVFIIVPYTQLEIYDPGQQSFVRESGEYLFISQPNSREDDFSLCMIEIDYPDIPPRQLYLETPAELYDSQTQTEIHTHFLTRKTHVRPTAWVGKLCYRNVDFSLARFLSLSLSAPVENAKVTVQIDEEPPQSLYVPGGDGYEDFHSYLLRVAHGGYHDIHITLENQCGIQSLMLVS